MEWVSMDDNSQIRCVPVAMTNSYTDPWYNKRQAAGPG